MRVYRDASVFAMNTAILFLALNILSIPVARLQARQATLRHRDPVDLQAVYPGLSLTEIENIRLERDRTNRWEYEAFTEFRQEPVAGRYFNVDIEGFRQGAGRQPWPPSPGTCSVLFFGGSTAYGDRLPDWETIPAALETSLSPARGCRTWSVYNFGRPGYYSTQERILFEQLLESGVTPKIAVFLDGLNEFFYPAPPGDGRPWRAGQTDNLSRLVREHNIAGSRYRFFQLFVGLPLIRVIRSALPGETSPHIAPTGGTCTASRTLERWRRNRRLTEGVAARFGVRLLFVWQPMPAYHDVAGDNGGGKLTARLECAKQGYELLAESRPGGASANFLWLADVQRARTKKSYLDDVHYTAAFSREIAAAIAGALVPPESSAGAGR